MMPRRPIAVSTTGQKAWRVRPYVSIHQSKRSWGDTERSQGSKADILYSMIKFFVLDVLLTRVVAVSTDPAPDSALAPSFFGRPPGQLPRSNCTMQCGSRQAKMIDPFP